MYLIKVKTKSGKWFSYEHIDSYEAKNETIDMITGNVYSNFVRIKLMNIAKLIVREE